MSDPVRLTATTTGHGGRVVLVHGFTQTGRSWRHVAAELARTHEVVCVDAPGHGDSGDLRLDLWQGADALISTGGQATYIGYSMGARVALHAALAHPGSVDRLLLLGGTPGLADEAERIARRANDEALADDLERHGLDVFLTRWLASPLFARLPADASDSADRRRNTIAGLASSLRLAGTGTQGPLWDRLPALEMPILVVAGEHDTKFVDIGRQMADAIGSNAQFAVVPDAGHAAHLEQPAAFVQLVNAFLAQ